MPGSRISLDLQGRPIVPNDPSIVFIEGDGPGPELIRITRDAVDRAVSAAYGSARRIYWVPALAGERARREKGSNTPETTLTEVRRHRLALVGPVRRQPGARPVVEELGRLLDLWFEIAWIRTPARADGTGGLDLAFFSDAVDDLAAGVEFVSGATPVAALLRTLGTTEEPLPADAPPPATPLDQLPFGTASRANAYREGRGELPTGVPPTGLVIRHTARQSAQRLAPQLATWSRRLLRPGLVVADESALHPTVATAARRWLEAAFADVPGVHLGPDAPEGALTVSFAAPPELLRALLSATPPSAVAAPAVTARRLRRLLADRGAAPRHVAVARLDPTVASGICTVLDPEPDAEWDAASPLPWVLAGALLLDTLGWDDAARELRTACDTLAAADRFPKALANDLGFDAAERLGTSAWSRALNEQFA